LWVGIEGRKRVGPKKNSAALIYSIFFSKRLELIRSKEVSWIQTFSNKIWFWRFWNKEQLSLLELAQIQKGFWIKKTEKPLGFEFGRNSSWDFQIGWNLDKGLTLHLVTNSTFEKEFEVQLGIYGLGHEGLIWNWIKFPLFWLEFD
jgi:hypothetical protein